MKSKKNKSHPEKKDVKENPYMKKGPLGKTQIFDKEGNLIGEQG